VPGPASLAGPPTVTRRRRGVEPATARRTLARSLAAQRTWAAEVPPRFAGATLDDLERIAEQAVVADDVRRWAAGPWRDGVSLLLMGPTGTGKTHIAFAAAREVVAHGVSLAYWNLTQLSADLDWRSAGHRDALDRAKQVGLLVLDDLGVEGDNDWMRSHVYDILDARWTHDRPTAITSNLLPATIAERVGERTYSRLIDGAAVGVRVTGPDLRRSSDDDDDGRGGRG
jgi:DNA replication protein DnaC